MVWYVIQITPNILHNYPPLPLISGKNVSIIIFCLYSSQQPRVPLIPVSSEAPGQTNQLCSSEGARRHLWPLEQPPASGAGGMKKPCRQSPIHATNLVNTQRGPGAARSRPRAAQLAGAARNACASLTPCESGGLRAALHRARPQRHSAMAASPPAASAVATARSVLAR